MAEQLRTALKPSPSSSLKTSTLIQCPVTLSNFETHEQADWDAFFLILSSCHMCVPHWSKLHMNCTGGCPRGFQGVPQAKGWANIEAGRSEVKPQGKYPG